MAREQKIKTYNKGIYSALDAENLPPDAASDAKNFVSKLNGLELVRGSELLGDLVTGAGGIYGLHVAYTATGTRRIFRKNSTKIQYLNGSTWTDVVTGLTADSHYTFTDVSNLAGLFVVASGVDGIYAIPTANPASYQSMYNATYNQKGKSIFDAGRSLMWDVAKDKTGLYLSKIDTATYTTVSAENIGTGNGSAVTFTDTLVQATGTRFVFGITATDGTESFTDNLDGTLTGSAGGTGIINYVTGAISVTFNDAPANLQAITCTYQWWDPNTGGFSDYRKSATRVAGEGVTFRQDIGGDAILNVIPLEGSYFSFKKKSVYQLTLSDDDTTASNKVFRQNVGIPHWRAVVATSTGIVFINTANPDGARLEILKRNLTGDSFDSLELAPQFKWGDYDYSEAALSIYGDYVVVACKDVNGDSAANNRVILVNMKLNPVAVDVTHFHANCFAVDSDTFFAGDSLSGNVYTIFSGFDDDDQPIEAYFITHKDTLGTEALKRIRKKRIRGVLSADQGFELYASYDDAAFELVGTVESTGNYVDAASPETVGSSMIGAGGIGGESDGVDVYAFLMEMNVKSPKFRQVRWKIVPTGLGYLRINHMHDFDVLMYEEKLPKKYR